MQDAWFLLINEIYNSTATNTISVISKLATFWPVSSFAMEFLFLPSNFIVSGIKSSR